MNILRVWYVNQTICVGWGEQLSHKFHMQNGIRQGSILSPYLFNVFMDELNIKLNQSNLGCHIANNPMNNLSWADDLVIITPSSHALCGMLAVCESFARNHLMIFNTKKTKCMLFNSRHSTVYQKPIIKLCDKVLEFVDNFTYLGHIISSNLTDDEDVMNQNRRLCARGNMLVRKFKSCSFDVKCTLFRALCYNVYGMSLWSNVKVSTLNRLRVNYNNVLRRLVNIPPWSSASEMFVTLRMKGFYELRRSCCYSLRSRILATTNSVVQRITNSDARWVSPLWQQWDTLLYIQHPRQ